jgi:hypothetical protein
MPAQSIFRRAAARATALLAAGALAAVAGAPRRGRGPDAHPPPPPR